MLRRIVTLAALLIAAPVVSYAADARLAWNDCDGAGGQHQITFDCNTNAAGDAAHTLIASFTAPAGITLFDALQAYIIIDAGSGNTLPSWWAVKGTGQCRNGAAVAIQDFTTGPYNCADLWSGNGIGGIASYNIGSGPSSARMAIVFAIPPASAIPLDEGLEYYAFKLRIFNTKTVGAGSCLGCDVPVALHIESLQLYQPDGTPGGNPILGDENGELTSRSAAGWQCPVQFGGGCLTPDPSSCSWYATPTCATPARSGTWGAIKSIYR